MRIVRRLLALAVAASGLLLSGATVAAAAEPYPIPPVTVTVNTATTVVGDSVTVFGSGFLPGEGVQVVPVFQGVAIGQFGRSAHGGLLKAPSVTVTADGNGNFSAVLTLDQVGRYLITATGLTSGRTGTVTVRVLPVGSALPVTGNDGSYLGILLIGGAVAATGIALVFFARSRRRSAKLES